MFVIAVVVIVVAVVAAPGVVVIEQAKHFALRSTKLNKITGLYWFKLHEFFLFMNIKQNVWLKFDAVRI